MNQHAERAYARRRCEAAVRCFLPRSSHCVDTNLANFSEGGLLLISNAPLPADERIELLVSPPPADGNPVQAPRMGAGHIRWSLPIKEKESLLYGAGVEFGQRSPAFFPLFASADRVACDLCARLVPAGTIRRTAPGGCLCPNCQAHLENVPDGIVRQHIERFLGLSGMPYAPPHQRGSEGNVRGEAG